MIDCNTKKCSKCGNTKPISAFKPRPKNKDGLEGRCHQCTLEYRREHRKKNSEHYKIKDQQYKRQAAIKDKQCPERTLRKKQTNKKWRESHKEYVRDKHKQWVQDNQDHIKEYRKQDYAKNKEAKNECSKKWQKEHQEHLRQYRLENKERIKFLKRRRDKKRKQVDLAYKLRCYMGSRIAMVLKKQNARKNGSCMNDLKYSEHELVQHLQSQYEWWMRDDNYGKYDPKTWNDNDPTTWKWNLDHIIPQSELPYQTTKEVNFSKCWSLSNLRPYSAKLNSMDGSTRIRHKKKENK